MAAKSPFLFAFNTTTSMYWIKVEPLYVEAQGPLLSTEVFVRIDAGDWKLPQDNQRVSSSVFQRSPIIIVVGLQIFTFTNPKTKNIWNSLFIRPVISFVYLYFVPIFELGSSIENTTPKSYSFKQVFAHPETF